MIPKSSSTSPIQGHGICSGRLAEADSRSAAVDGTVVRRGRGRSIRTGPGATSAWAAADGLDAGALSVEGLVACRAVATGAWRAGVGVAVATRSTTAWTDDVAAPG